MKTLVLGLGNPVLTDDGVGWHVVGELRRRGRLHPEVELEECCRGGLSLMERMVGYDVVVVVDAAASGGRVPPGTVRRLAVGDAPTRHSASAHDASLATALAVGRAAGAHLPSDLDVYLVGVEAAECAVFSEVLTPAVAAAVPYAAAVVEGLLARGKEVAWR